MSYPFSSRRESSKRPSTSFAARRKLRRAAESARPRPAQYRCGLEPLEDRRLMSVSVAVNNGVLNLNGTDAADLIAVNPTVNGPSGTATSWSVTTREGTGPLTTTPIDNVSTITGIVINGGGGADNLRVSNLINVRARIDGGAGNDYVVGGGGADSLSGGGDTDSLYGQLGNDALDGGDGVDRAYGGAGVDTLAGVCGEDLLSGGAGDDVLQATFNPLTFFHNHGAPIAPPAEYLNAANGQDTLQLKLDLGSVVREFVKPIVGRVQDVTRGLQPIVDLYNKKIPVLSYLDSSLTFGKVLDSAGKFRPLTDAVSGINSLNLTDGFGVIDYGSFSLSASAIQRTSLANPFARVPSFQGTLDKLGKLGLAFPILSDPANAARIVFGQNLDLFTYTLPKIDFKFSDSFTKAVPGLGVTIPSKVPVFGGKSLGLTATVGYNGSLKAGGKVGVDMAGVQSGNLLDGFFATSDTGAALTLGVTAKGGANLAIASGWLGGNLNTTVSAYVRDSNNDGKSRLSEMAAGSTPFVFNVGGSYNLQGQLKASAVKIPVPFFDDITIWGGYNSGVRTFTSGTFNLA